MKLYAEKGYALTEAERLELGRLLLKGGYVVMMGKEKVGSTARYYIEFYRKVEFGEKKAALRGANTEDGAAQRANETPTV